MEYSRKIPTADGALPTAGSSDSRVMDFGSVFLVTPTKIEGDDSLPPAPVAPGQQTGVNVSELVIARGFGTVIRHRDFEERSNHYDALLSAESRAIAQKRGIHSAKESPVNNVNDLSTVCEVLSSSILSDLFFCLSVLFFFHVVLSYIFLTGIRKES